MTVRETIYSDLKIKMKECGFLFEREQQPHRQNRKESELVFVHPRLNKSFEEAGYKVHAKKFYIKPLSDEENCEIGLVTGITSPLYNLTEFIKPNTLDSKRESPAWTNKKEDFTLDKLLSQIKTFLASTPNIADKSLNTFLITWNPQKWDWVDLQESIEHLEKVGYVIRRWSCGNSKSIKKGDRVFLVRLGDEPKGILGSGYSKSSYFTAPHWDGTKGKTTNYIDIEFDILINPSENIIFDKELLDKTDSFKIQQWFPQQSGITIKPEIISLLETNWFDFIRLNKYIANGFVSNDDVLDETNTYMEGKSKEITQTRYERNPQARKTCLKHHGYSCQICGFNFEKIYGGIGKGFIHVHHINAIAGIGKEYEVEPKNDLIPVCPNCHAMIHSKRPAFTIDELRETIKTTANKSV